MKKASHYSGNTRAIPWRERCACHSIQMKVSVVDRLLHNSVCGRTDRVGARADACLFVIA
jgi:hypothetical protein